MLYDLVQCPHRLTLDLRGDQGQRDTPNPFVQMLWKRGTLYEDEIVANLKEPFLDLSAWAGTDLELRTAQAIERKEPLIYGGRIAADNLVGEPDLLRLRGDKYIAADIKSGSGYEGDEDDGKLKKHYAVQLALYTDILERKGLSADRTPYILDIHGDEVTYRLDEPVGTRNPITMWAFYKQALATAEKIAAAETETLPASSAKCGLCHWYSACLEDLKNRDDLTLIPELGRPKRDAMYHAVPTMGDLAAADLSIFANGKKSIFKGIGLETIDKFQRRARLIKENGKPYLTAPVNLPVSEVELFFDIEVDPMRDFCYLHGFVERRQGDSSNERYHAFFADATDGALEEKAFRQAVEFIRERSPCAVYYYSKYERTWWRKLQQRYPTVCSADEINDLFDPQRSVDLYLDVVKCSTEWPTSDHSIKTLAKYLGFDWRDTHPSGAASIEWFDRWINEQNPEMRQRILGYNEDDCRATRVLLDGIRSLQ